MSQFSSFTLQAADLSQEIAHLAEVDRGPLETRIADACVAFAIGSAEAAYRMLHEVRGEADRIDRERGTTGAPAREACVSGM